MNLKFSKWHGLGNDFVFLTYDEFKKHNLDSKELAIKICDRNFGIGADGLIIIGPYNVSSNSFRLKIINSDGSEAEMCGNGTRCAANFLYEENFSEDTTINLETLAGLIKTSLVFQDDRQNPKNIKSVTVDMGEPKLTRKEMNLSGNADEKIMKFPLEILGNNYFITCVSMGNPHCVIFVDNVDEFPLEAIGSLIENHEMFPAKTNVEFVEILSPDQIRLRVFERGAGVTKACGTGACAAVVAGFLNGYTTKNVEVKLDGGTLNIVWQDDNHVIMSGPTKKVFVGEYFLD